MSVSAAKGHYTPKELSAALAAVGLFISERSIERRCALPEGHPRRIATNPNFRRCYIPAAEFARLSGAEVPA